MKRVPFEGTGECNANLMCEISYKQKLQIHPEDERLHCISPRQFSVSCLIEHPKIENAVVAYDGWDGKFPAPPGAGVIYTCRSSSRFTDGASTHNAICSLQPNDTWITSFHEKDVRCQGQPFQKFSCLEFLFRSSGNIMPMSEIFRNSLLDDITRGGWKVFGLSMKGTDKGSVVHIVAWHFVITCSVSFQNPWQFVFKKSL